VVKQEALMPVVALDTHAVVKELQAAGFTEAQAEAVTRAVRKGQDIDFSDLATKADFQTLRFEFDGLRKDFEGLRKDFTTNIEGLHKETRAETGSLRKETKAEINALKFDLLKWIIGAIGVQTVAILGAVLTLARVFAR